MKRKQIIKIVTDVLMTVILLLLMAYSLVGETAHEWLGIGMFILFILHHILNSKWGRSLFRGKYTSIRILQIVLVVLSLFSMLGSMISGVILSRYVLDFLPITGGLSWARTLHKLSAYWGFVFISLHLGLHWSMLLGMVRRMWRKPAPVRSWAVRLFGFLIAGYGVFAFIRREVGSYMLLKIQFVFFDFEEPFVLFLLDYIAVMGLFVFIGHYIAEVVRRAGGRSRR